MKKTHYNHHRHHHNHHHHHHHNNNHHCHSFSSPLWCRLSLRSFGSKISHFPSSRLVTFQHKIDFQPRRSSFLKKKQEIVFVFQRLAQFSSYWAHIGTQQSWIHCLYRVLMWESQPFYWALLHPRAGKKTTGRTKVRKMNERKNE